MASYRKILEPYFMKRNLILASCNLPKNLLSESVQRNKWRRFNTLSSLAVTFNAKQNEYQKLNIFRYSQGLFGMSELKNAEGFYLLKENAMLETHFLIKECCSSNRKRKMVEVFDHLSNSLCKVADLAEFVRMAHPDYEYSIAAEDICGSIGGKVEELNANKPLYDALKKVVQHGDALPTTDVDQHVAQLFLFDFEQCGIHLDDTARRRVTSLNESILKLGQKFMAVASQPRAVPSKLFPEDVAHDFAIDDENLIIPGYLSDSSDETKREASYKIFLLPDSLQEEILVKLLTQRKEMASLCGFPSYAHRSVKGSLAESPELVQEFLEKLSTELKPMAAEEFQEMDRIKKQINKSSKDVAPWDVPYLTGLARRNLIPTDIGKVSAYFSLGTVMEGLSDLLFDLFGIHLQIEDPLPGELWSPGVHRLTVFQGNDVLGIIYCDFFERQGKIHQDCHFTIQGGKEMRDGSYQNPIVVLHLNLPMASGSSPCLLSLSMLENLFHEMGHAIHSMLARTKYQHVTGTRCSTDFAEVPSLLFEFFANDARVLSRFAVHYKTGDPLPYQVLQKLLASKCSFSAVEMQLQNFYCILDQKYHSTDISFTNVSTTDVLAEVQNKYYGLPYVPNTSWQLRFGHLVGYGAKYYSYLMARAVASWIWQNSFAEDPFNSDSGHKLQKEVLCHGGGKPAQAMVSDFLGKKVDPENLVAALVSDLQKKKNLLHGR